MLCLVGPHEQVFVQICQVGSEHGADHLVVDRSVVLDVQELFVCLAAGDTVLVDAREHRGVPRQLVIQSDCVILHFDASPG